MIVAIILWWLMAVCYLVGTFMGERKDLEEWAKILIGIVLSTLFAGLFWCAYFMETNNEDTYYLPCEVLASNDTSTYFGAVDSGSQEIFAVKTGDHVWPDDVPYLLYMDGKGTQDVKDDEVLVIWRTD
nr:MAG TPA: hypothetical protein [Caudoviricetes sp.]